MSIILIRWHLEMPLAEKLDGVRHTRFRHVWSRTHRLWEADATRISENLSADGDSTFDMKMTPGVF